MSIDIRLDVIMAERRIKLGDLAKRIGIAEPNLSILKNNKARAIRFSTLNALCRELDCQPGDLIIYKNDTELDKRQD